MTIYQLIHKVCGYTGVSALEIVSKSRLAPIVKARHLVFYIARTNLKLTLTEIGKHCKRDHSTVINGVTQVEDEMSYNTEVKEWVIAFQNSIEKELNDHNLIKNRMQTTTFTTIKEQYDLTLTKEEMTFLPEMLIECLNPLQVLEHTTFLVYLFNMEEMGKSLLKKAASIKSKGTFKLSKAQAVIVFQQFNHYRFDAPYCETLSINIVGQIHKQTV